ncbi:acetoin utilization AcuB family protein [Metabacillus rhizolycopersici]|jgi:acetoin utilization protein AcuB|uniref:Acetoin utilization AcuB family protein n=1 Tax=Metabacillus rhizolycopersici TaxID=2875709 RepID=A0ABS7UPP2_9BACI|nr:acetoin utilization AcuB family protein [Metabacillus rhizolycopersici]MBZ5750131.1 acetoin utilization AcuB family protein [Metabacillus rhizolycopersici]
MIVRQIMNKNVITLSSKDTIRLALETMKQNRIRHIPIVKENDCLVGIITERDVKDASPSIFQRGLNEDFLNKPIKSIMSTNLITGHPLDFVEEIAAVLIEHKIGCLPILQDGRLVGLLTETDLLHTFVKLTGADQPASHIEIKVPNVAGMLAEVSSIFQRRGVNIASVLIYPDSVNQYKILVFRVQTMNLTMIINDLQTEGFEVLWPNILGNDK